MSTFDEDDRTAGEREAMAEARGAPAVHRARPTTALVADPRQLALFLDLDGTLVDIAATPDSVVVREGLVDELSEPLDGYDGAYRLLVGNLAAFRTVTVDAADLPKIGARLGRRGGLMAEAVLTVDGAHLSSQWPEFAVPVLIERLSLSDETGELLRREAR